MSDLTFYEDSIYSESMSEKEAYDRSKLKLDFGSASAISATKRNTILAGTPSNGALLQSPDLMLLKLGSPELENLIMQNNGLITTTPTPTDSSISDQSTVEERENFAAGFVRALQKLQQHGETNESIPPCTSTEFQKPRSTQNRSQGFPYYDMNANSVSVKKEIPEPSVSLSQLQSRPNGYQSQTWVKSDANPIHASQTSISRTQARPVITNRPSCIQESTQNHQRLRHIANSQPSVVRYAQHQTDNGLATRSNSSSSGVYPASNTGLTRTIPQTGVNIHQASSLQRTVPSSSAYPVISSVGSASSSPRPPTYKLEDEAQIVPSNTPPLQSTPIDLKMQEIIKHERKKLRNRLAAQRCRKRKIEREDELKEKVKELKMTYSELTSTRTELRKQVIELKQKVMNHVNQGCHVYLPTSSGVMAEGITTTVA